MSEPEKKLPEPGQTPTDREVSVGSRFQHDDVHQFGDAGDDDYDDTDGEGAGFQQAAVDSQGKTTRPITPATQDKTTLSALPPDVDASVEIPLTKDAPLAPSDDKQWSELQKNIDATAATFDQKIEEFDQQVTVNTPSLTMLQKMSIETMRKLGKTAFESDNPTTKTVPESLKKQRQELQTELEKSHEFQRVHLDGMKPIELQPEVFRVVKACVLISSGDDTKIKAGEEQLARLIVNNPTLQADRDFSDTVLKSYLEMANRRHARGLPDWKSDLKAEQFLPKETAAPDRSNETQSSLATSPGERTSDPLTLLQTANEKYWSEGIRSALPDFNKAFEASEKLTASSNRERLESFIAGLSRDSALASAQARGEDTEALMDERLDIQARENRAVKDATANDTMRLSIGINTCFAKIASGDSKMYAEGVEQLGKFIEQNPDMALDEQFSTNCTKAFKAHYENGGLAAAPVGQPDGGKGGGADGPADNGAGDTEELQPGWHKIDLSTTYNSPDGADKPVDAYFSDQLTTALLVAAGVGMATTSIVRTVRQYRENRELRATYGPQELETESSNKDTFLRRNAFDKEKVEVLGKTAESDRVVIRNAENANDWKNTPKDKALDLPADFNLKKREYGDYERLRIKKADYFADKAGNVFLLRGDKLYPTKEIEVMSQEQFAKDSREIRSLHDPGTIRDVVDSLRIADRSVTAVQAKMIEIAKGLGLPEPRLLAADPVAGDIRNAGADYALGKGEIRIPQHNFGWGMLDADVMAKVTHEMVHLEQDTLMVRRIADKLGIGKDFASPEQIKELQRSYQNETRGPELDADFARRVIDSRAGRHLSPAEQERADGYLERTKVALSKRISILNAQQGISDALVTLGGDTAEGFIKKIADNKVSARVLGPDPPEQLKELIERAQRGEDLKSTPGWNDKAVKQQLAETMKGRRQDLNGMYFDIYAADKFEIEAFDVSRFTALECARDPFERNPQKEASIDLAYRMLEPNSQRAFSHAMDEAAKQTDFAKLSPSEKGDVLTKRFREALKESLQLDGRELPGSLSNVEIKVGDYKRYGLVLTNGATEADRHFEIRVPESNLHAEFMRHNAIATIYGDTYHLLAEDIKMGSPASHLLQSGEHHKGSGAEALRVRAEQALAAERPSFRENPALMFDVARDVALRNIPTDQRPWNVSNSLREGRGFVSSLEPSVIKEKMQAILDGPRPEVALAVLEQAGVRNELFPKGDFSSVEAARQSVLDYETLHAKESPAIALRREIAEFARLNSKMESGLVHGFAFQAVDKALASTTFEGDRDSYGRLAGLVREEARNAAPFTKVILKEVAQFLEGKAGLPSPESTDNAAEAPAKENIKPVHPLEKHLGLPADVTTDKLMSDRLIESRQLLGSKEGGEPAARWARHARLVDEALSRYRELELKGASRSVDQNAEFADLQKGLTAERKARAAMLGARQPTADKIDVQSTTGGSTKGGDTTQGFAIKQIRVMLDKPSAALGGMTPTDAGFRILPVRNALDGLGWDAILLNTNTGDFVFLDPTRDNPESEGSKKTNLPAMHEDGLVFVDADIVDIDDKKRDIQKVLDLNLKRFDPALREGTSVVVDKTTGASRPLSGTLNVVDIDLIGAEFSPGQQVSNDKRDIRDVIAETRQITDPAERRDTARELSERYGAIRETQAAVIAQLESMTDHQRQLARNGGGTTDSAQRASELGSYTSRASSKSMFFEHAKSDTQEIANAAGKILKQQEAKAELARAQIRGVTDKLGSAQDLEALRQQAEQWKVQESIVKAATREEAAEGIGYALMEFEEGRQRNNDPLHTKLRVEFSDDVNLTKSELKFRLDGVNIDLIGLDGDRIVDRGGQFAFKAKDIETVIVLPEKFRTDANFRAKVVEAVFIQLANLDLLTSGQALPPGMTAKEVAGNKQHLATMDAKQLEIMTAWKKGLTELMKAGTTSGTKPIEQAQQEQQQGPDQGTKPAEQQKPAERTTPVETQSRSQTQINTLDEAVAEYSRVLEDKKISPDSKLKTEFDDLVETLKENEGRPQTKDAIKYIAQLARQIEGKSPKEIAELTEHFEMKLVEMQHAFGKYGTDRNRNKLKAEFAASAEGKTTSHAEVTKLAQLVAAAKVSVKPGELAYQGIPGWSLKMDGDKPAMQDGNLILVHDGVMKISSDKVTAVDIPYKSATPNPDKTTTISLGFDKPIEVAISPVDLVMEQSNGQSGGKDTCSACVASFLKNIGSADGLAGVLKSGEFATPQGLQRAIGKVGPGGQQVNQDLLYNIMGTKTDMNSEAMKPGDFGLNSKSLVRISSDMLASRGPAIYIAVDPYVTTGDASATHTYLIAVDSNGKSTIYDPYHGFVAEYTDRSFESLAIVTGDAAERAKQNLGLIKNVESNVFSPIADETLKTYLQTVEHRLSKVETHNQLEAFKEITRELLGDSDLVLSRDNRAAVEDAQLISKAAIVEANIGANNSKLVIKEISGKGVVAIEPKSYNREKGSFVVSDGAGTREVPLKNCQVEIQVGTGTTGGAATREVLKRFTELGLIIEGKAGTGPEAAKQVHAQLDKLSQAFDETVTKVRAAEKTTAPTAATATGFRFGIDKGVTTTKYGISYGEKSFTHLELVERSVEELTKEKEQLAKEKASDQNKEKIAALDKTIDDLNRIKTSINEGGTLNAEELKVVVEKSFGREMGLMKEKNTAEGRRGRIAANAVSNAGTYAVLVSMAVGLIIEGQGEDSRRYKLDHAPTGANR